MKLYENIIKSMLFQNYKYFITTVLKIHRYFQLSLILPKYHIKNKAFSFELLHIALHVLLD